MEAKNFWRRELRQLFRVFDVVVVSAVLGSKIEAGRRKLVVVVKNLFAVIVIEQLKQAFTIVLVCDSTTVVALAGQIPQSLKRGFFLVFVNENVKLLD